MNIINKFVLNLFTIVLAFSIPVCYGMTRSAKERNLRELVDSVSADGLKAFLLEILAPDEAFSPDADAALEEGGGSATGFSPAELPVGIEVAEEGPPGYVEALAMPVNVDEPASSLPCTPGASSIDEFDVPAIELEQMVVRPGGERGRGTHSRSTLGRLSSGTAKLIRRSVSRIIPSRLRKSVSSLFSPSVLKRTKADPRVARQKYIETLVYALTERPSMRDDLIENILNISGALEQQLMWQGIAWEDVEWGRFLEELLVLLSQQLPEGPSRPLPVRRGSSGGPGGGGLSMGAAACAGFASAY